MIDRNSHAALTALVTGATGFIGSHLVRKLLAEGGKVHIIARNDSSLKQLGDVQGAITIHRHDGTIDSMFAIVESAKPDLVIHLASFATVTYAPRQVEEMLTSNIIFGTQLVEAMLSQHVYAFINTGTFSQHFDNKLYSPKSLYDASKQAFTDILAYYCESSPLRVITLELFDNYGPNDTRSKIISLLLKAGKEQKPLAMSPGEQLIDIVHIDDVVEAYMLAAQQLLNEGAVKNEVYSVSSQQPIPLKELAGIIEKIMDVPLQVNWGGRPYHPREIMIPWNKGAVVPKWKPKITLEEGIKRLIEQQQ
ncbi:hypothetical protein BK120_25060 [Paenibacillus sp. FSL A5-0031]|uniref:NAD-dependent epimerase/dehydratase family protein n=1 Tax=Paenibacillus sp. FSL A5-0031 TaxID=1920420 RepID=UPI00096FEAD4|nr:NAD-dependent epimerase/dehydratase family protein [Paenibacillus sp. FSL A5-0031]OME77969.1 hypothetical protein BK120_25060 [Paenibacillus sp. FSL A5-0031]